MTGAAVDHMGMDSLTEVAELLFGDGAYELVAKMSPTSSDLSTQQREKHERIQARVGLATNVVGLGAGVTGTAAAYKNFQGARAKAKAKATGLPPKPKEYGRIARGAMDVGNKFAGTKIGGHAVKAGVETGKFIARHPVAVAGAGLGLQGLNLGGDFVANRVLARSARKPKKRSDYALAKAMLPTGRLNHIGNAAIGTGLFAGGVGATYEGDKIYRKKRGKQPIAKRHQHSPNCVHMRLTRGKLVATAIEGGAPHVKSAASKAAATGKPMLISAEKKVERKLVAKSDELDIVWEGEFAKFDTDKRQVFGWASIVELNGEPIVDLQGDFIPADEIEKAAYEYVQKSRRGGDMHRRDGENAFHASEMIESFMVTPEKVEKMGLPAGSLPTGWWVGYQVHDDDTWNLVKSGKRTGFSIHGRGKRADA